MMDYRRRQENEEKQRMEGERDKTKGIEKGGREVKKNYGSREGSVKIKEN